jgi:hypothetical protein
MPLSNKKGKKAVSENIKELHKGKQFGKTSDKFGKDKANKQAVAIALEKAGKSKKHKRTTSDGYMAGKN